MAVTVLVTGADGFIGGHVCCRLAEGGAQVIPVVRRIDGSGGEQATVAVDDISAKRDWSEVVRGVDVVVHLAAITHSGDLCRSEAYARYAAVNVDATLALARAAREAGAKRFVFMSSIKVNGEYSSEVNDELVRFTAADPPQPEDHYGRTKWQAEQGLAKLAGDSFALVILRPPLVYGPGQKGNLLRLMQWVADGRPLPLSSVKNARSLIYVGNLADATADAVFADARLHGTFTLADIELSTPELVRAMASALNVRPRLFRLPLLILHAMLSAIGKGGMAARLTGSLVVDASVAREQLGWSPATSFETAMKTTAEWFLQDRA